MVSLFEIVSFFDEQKSLIDRGEKAEKASDIQQFSYDPSSGTVSAKVHASMKNRLYTVKIILVDGKISSSMCECAKGQAKCHHMAAVLIYVSKNISSTDQPCVWNVAKDTKAPKKFEDLFGVTKSVLKRKPTDEDRDFLKQELKRSAPHCGLTWIMKDEPCITEHAKSFQSITLENNYALSDKALYIVSKFTLNESEVKEIFLKTTGQRTNASWGIYRKGRITASNFGLVLKAIISNKVTPSLLKTLNGEYCLDKVKTVQWGITHEKNALDVFSKVMKVELTFGGIYFHPSGLIGCSPDALVKENALLEIKCPASKLNSDLLKEIKEKKWYLIPKGNVLTIKMHKVLGNTVYELSDCIINLKHPLGYKYYHQIQGMLHIMGKHLCYFMVWTPTTSLIVPVEKELIWKENLEKIISFYKNTYIYTLI